MHFDLPDPTKIKNKPTGRKAFLLTLKLNDVFVVPSDEVVLMQNEGRVNGIKLAASQISPTHSRMWRIE